MNKRNNYSNISGYDLQCEIKRGGYVSELFKSTRSCIMAALEMKDERVIVPISFGNQVQIYAYAFIYSLWICAKTLVRWFWNYNVSTTSKTRDSPPLILVDSTVGRHSYVKVKGAKLHYVEAGQRGNPPILLLHGFPDCWVGWRHQFPALSTSHRLVALDLLGCGDSDKPASRYEYSPAKVLAQLKMVLEGLAAQPPHRAPTVIAHDLGGLLAWFLAHECSELIERLVIISSPHPNIFWDSLPAASPFNASWMYTAQVPYLVEYEALRGDMALLDKCHTHLNKKTLNGSSSTLIEAYKYVFSRRQDWSGPINYFRNFIFWRVTEDRGKIKIPVLIITGNKDLQVSLECMVRSSEWCSQATLKIVDGAGHFPQQECPQDFNRLLNDFLIMDRIVPVPKPGLGVMGVDAARGLVGRMLGAVHLFT